jgi:ribosomal protein S30
VLDEKADDPPAGVVRHVMAVVKNEQEGGRVGKRGVQVRQRTLDGGCSGRRLQAGQTPVDSRHFSQREGQIGEQDDRVVVVVVELQPDVRSLLRLRPLEKHGSLARAGGRRHQHERLPGAAQRLDEHPARDRIEAQPGRMRP